MAFGSSLTVSRPGLVADSSTDALHPFLGGTLSTESSDSFVASAAASIATGWSEPVPGREFHPLKSNAFHGALLRQLWALEVGKAQI
jgi:hypothetical protein